MRLNFWERVLAAFVWVIEQVWKNQPKKTRFVISKVRDKDGTTFWGDIKKMKKEFGFSSTFEATPVGAAGADYEHGSAQWSYSAKDADGNDVSSQFSLEVDPNNELRCRITHDGSQSESTGVLTLRADGDPDADETANVVGTADIVVDAPNVTAFELKEVTDTGGDTGGGDTGVDTGAGEV